MPNEEQITDKVKVLLQKVTGIKMSQKITNEERFSFSSNRAKAGPMQIVTGDAFLLLNERQEPATLGKENHEAEILLINGKS